MKCREEILCLYLQEEEWILSSSCFFWLLLSTPKWLNATKYKLVLIHSRSSQFIQQLGKENQSLYWTSWIVRGVFYTPPADTVCRANLKLYFRENMSQQTNVSIEKNHEKYLLQMNHSRGKAGEPVIKMLGTMPLIVRKLLILTAAKCLGFCCLKATVKNQNFLNINSIDLSMLSLYTQFS